MKKKMLKMKDVNKNNKNKNVVCNQKMMKMCLNFAKFMLFVHLFNVCESVDVKNDRKRDLSDLFLPLQTTSNPVFLRNLDPTAAFQESHAGKMIIFLANK